MLGPAVNLRGRLGTSWLPAPRLNGPRWRLVLRIWRSMSGSYDIASPVSDASIRSCQIRNSSLIASEAVNKCIPDRQGRRGVAGPAGKPPRLMPAGSGVRCSSRPSSLSPIQLLQPRYLPPQGALFFFRIAIRDFERRGRSRAVHFFDELPGRRPVCGPGWPTFHNIQPWS